MVILYVYYLLYVILIESQLALKFTPKAGSNLKQNQLFLAKFKYLFLKSKDWNFLCHGLWISNKKDASTLLCASLIFLKVRLRSEGVEKYSLSVFTSHLGNVKLFIQLASSRIEKVITGSCGDSWSVESRPTSDDDLVKTRRVSTFRLLWSASRLDWNVQGLHDWIRNKITYPLLCWLPTVHVNIRNVFSECEKEFLFHSFRLLLVFFSVFCEWDSIARPPLRVFCFGCWMDTSPYLHRCIKNSSECVIRRSMTGPPRGEPVCKRVTCLQKQTSTLCSVQSDDMMNQRWWVGEIRMKFSYKKEREIRDYGDW